MDKHLLATAKDRHGESALLNGRIDGDGGSSVWGPWGGMVHEASFVLDLHENCLISKASLWSCEDEGARGVEWFSLACGVESMDMVEVVRRRVRPDEISPTRKLAIPLDCELAQPVLARYVRVTVRRNPKRHQMVLGEFALWGRPANGETGAQYLPDNARPTVAFQIDGFASGAAVLDWSSFEAPGEVSGWNVYAAGAPFDDVRRDDVVRLGTLPAKTKSYLLYPLNPDTERHYAVTAVYGDREHPKVKSQVHRPIAPLEVRRFSDMLGINFYWGGGSANEPGLPSTWYSVVADFLARSPFRKIRWWKAPEPFVIKEFYPRRLEVSNRCDDLAVCKKYGIYLHYANNEPELRDGMTPAKSVANLREQRAKWGALGPGHVFYGPVVNVDRRGFDFLKAFVQAGGAEWVDAIDLHTYCGRETEFAYPKGYPWGSPEVLIARVGEIRSFLKQQGVDKPLMASEWGYSDTTVMNTHMEDPTPLRKAQFLVRGCLIHHRLGFRRLYLYSFFDEGSDATCSEHLYGIVSRDLQKKPAYHALETMVTVLGDTLFDHEAKDNPGMGDYVYVFRRVDGAKFVTAVWNGARTRSVRLRAGKAKVERIEMFGERGAVMPDASGYFSLKIGPSPLYLVSERPIEF